MWNVTFYCLLVQNFAQKSRFAMLDSEEGGVTPDVGGGADTRSGSNTPT